MNALLRDPALVVADAWQRGLPLVSQPFRQIGEHHDLTEREVIDGLARLKALGILGRVGAVARPHAAGASTLAALSCPPDEIDRVAAIVSAEPGVNHNYQRQHAVNLWFVAAAANEAELARTLQRIAAATGYEVLDLRLQRAFHIDLGFRLSRGAAKPHFVEKAQRLATKSERQLLAAMEDGLPLEPQPFAAIAARLGWSETSVIDMLDGLQQQGIITRLGCVLNHRALGFTCNAMAVWDVADNGVDAAGQALARLPGITLCYRRNRQAPQWPYNLFAMIHGSDETDVRRQIAESAAMSGLADCASAVLFSRRCFTQRGARFAARDMAA